MSKFIVSGLVALGLWVPALPLSAHHGTAGSYDQNKTITVQGTVKEFWWRNPHSALFLDANDESGKPVTYALEMGSPQTLVKFGYTRTTFKPGDKVTMPMHPSFTNPVNGEALSRNVTVNGNKLKDAGGPNGAPGGY